MEPERPEAARDRLVDDLVAAGRLSDERVARAMRAVPRHEFVPQAVCDHAYEDRPLRIGREQVITAPHLVAQMAELLDLRPGQTVLEVGTGSGYHAAVIAEIVGPGNVLTIERFPDLAASARAALDRTGYGEVTVLVGDGSRGLPCHPPFDRIDVTAVAPTVPVPLVDQLADDGLMVLPLGPRDGPHELVVLTKRAGRVERTSHGGVRFVPLVGEHGFEAGG